VRKYYVYHLALILASASTCIMAFCLHDEAGVTDPTRGKITSFSQMAFYDKVGGVGLVASGLSLLWYAGFIGYRGALGVRCADLRLFLLYSLMGTICIVSISVALGLLLERALRIYA